MIAYIFIAIGLGVMLMGIIPLAAALRARNDRLRRVSAAGPDQVLAIRPNPISQAIAILFSLCLVVIGAIPVVMGVQTAGRESASSPLTGSVRDDYDALYKEASWIEKGQSSVRSRLKDPASAQFRNSVVKRTSGTPVVCGEVNSRNSFGGFSGFKRFVSAGRSDLTFLEEQVSDFETVWAKMC
jgi:hypothetical protein